MYHLVPGPAVPHFAPCDVGVYVPLVPGPAGSATLREVHLVPDPPGTTLCDARRSDTGTLRRATGTGHYATRDADLGTGTDATCDVDVYVLRETPRKSISRFAGYSQY